MTRALNGHVSMRMRNKLLIALFLLLPLVYWPGFQGERWIMLSLALPVVWFFAPQPAVASCCGWPHKLSGAHWFLVAFLCWAALTALWAISPYEVGYRMWHFLILGVAFWIGATLDRITFRWCIFAFGIAIAVNGVAVLWQASNYHLLQFDPIYWQQTDTTDYTPRWLKPRGMFDTANRLAWATAIALAGMICLRKKLAELGRWTMVFMLPALLIPMSKAAFVALALVGIGYAKTPWLVSVFVSNIFHR